METKVTKLIIPVGESVEDAVRVLNKTPDDIDSMQIITKEYVEIRFKQDLDE